MLSETIAFHPDFWNPIVSSKSWLPASSPGTGKRSYIVSPRFAVVFNAQDAVRVSWAPTGGSFLLRKWTGEGGGGAGEFERETNVDFWHTSAVALLTPKDAVVAAAVDKIQAVN